MLRGGVIERPEPIIYAITPDGKLNWYKHTGYYTGTSGLEGAISISLSGLADIPAI